MRRTLIFILCVIVVASIFVGIKDHFDNKKCNRKIKTVYEDGVKRAFDFFIAMMVLILFSPIYLLLYVLVAICLGRPVLFIQERPGRDEKSFNLYKFRTMTEKRDEEGKLLPDNDRLTKFGVFLRSFMGTAIAIRASFSYGLIIPLKYLYIPIF